MYRAASYLEKNPYYKSDDYVAPMLLPHLVKFFVKLRLVDFRWPIFPKGIYEYVIARTKYIDELFRKELEKGIDQILIMGAGFDTRAIRFENINRSTTIYELDSVHTQKAKIRQLRERGISSPGSTIYIPVDFNTESPADKIKETAFDPSKKTLFLMEGLIMYLTNEAVTTLFGLLSDLASSGSIVVFDYIYASVLRRENSCYGEKSIYGKVNSVNEAWQFGIENGGVEGFAKSFGFTLVRNLTPADLERTYFTDNDNNPTGRVNGTHCIAHLEK